MRGGLCGVKQLSSGKRELESKERVHIEGTFGGKYRVFAIFIICVALLGAAFAVSSIWRTTESGQDFFDRIGAFFGEDADESREPSSPPPQSEQEPSREPLLEGDPIPEGAVIVRGADLSYLSLGEQYYLNETDYAPGIEALLARELDLSVAATGEPLVLIVHTHTVEAYLPKETSYIEGSVSAATYSEDAERNMLAVGRVLADQLNENGIPTIQCTRTHTGDGMSLQGAYAREAESVREYLRLYPSIRLVIDLHRDAVMNAEGEYVRTEAPQEDGFAQVMAVVGSDANGTPCNWEGNLALALQLRRALNTGDSGLARPVYLRKSSFNQELAEYSLLLEIGTGANTVEEAKRTAQRVGDALSKLIVHS